MTGTVAPSLSLVASRLRSHAPPDVVGSTGVLVTFLFPLIATIGTVNSPPHSELIQKKVSKSGPICFDDSVVSFDVVSGDRRCFTLCISIPAR